MLKNVLLAFIPIFIAVDAVGVLPIFISLTQGYDKRVKSQIILQSVFTATCLAVGFIFLGKSIFALLGITIGDFMIAGGVILFCIAIMDMLLPGDKRRIPVDEMGPVPLGTPLIVGPAVLTTSLIIIVDYGLLATLISILINLLLAGVIFYLSDILIRIIGISGTKALSKIISLLLAAIAVMMIRKGFLLLLR